MVVDKNARDARTLSVLEQRVKKVVLESTPQHFMLLPEGAPQGISINFVVPVECPEFFYKNGPIPEGVEILTKEELILALPPEYLQYLDYAVVEKMIDIINTHGCGDKAVFYTLKGNCWIASARMIALLLVEPPQENQEIL